MRLTDNDFQLFGLPETQAQSRADIDARWKALQAEVHPDRFASEGAAAQRVAMQWAMRVNEAYQRLKHPLKRAAYLCELRGAPVQAENNTAMPAAFLMQQMEWREAIDEARAGRSVDALDAISDDLRTAHRRIEAQLAEQIDVAHDYAAASEAVRQLRFMDKLIAEVGDVYEELES